jgi:hypothetical protein
MSGQSIVLLYTNNKLAEKEVRKTIPFMITSKRIKYLAINLAKKEKPNKKTSIVKTIKH